MSGYRTVEIRGCCRPCFGAKCRACGAWLTKHDYTQEDASASAEAVLAGRTGFPHDCPKAGAPIQTELAAHPTLTGDTA